MTTPDSFEFSPLLGRALPTPYYEDEGVTLYLGDCRDIVPRFGHAFDLVLTDPPYGDTSLTWDRWPDGWLKISPVARQMWCLADGIAGQSLVDSWRALPVACPATDRYDDTAAELVDALALQAVAGCGHIAIDTTGRDLDGDGDGLSLSLIRQARAHGLRVLLFTGIAPENFPTWTALVDSDGAITSAGRAVQAVLSEVRP